MQTNRFQMLALALLAALTLAGDVVQAAEGLGTIRVSADRPGVRISPDLYGIFFEDINLSADGGLYPELIRNRSFEDSAQQPEQWTASGAPAKLTLDRGWPESEFNQRSLRVELGGAGRAGVANKGYWGVAVRKGETYALRLFARATGLAAPLVARIESPDGAVWAEEQVGVPGTEWREYALKLKADHTGSNGIFTLTAEGPGTVWLDFVSLRPAQTWKNHGLRRDVAAMLDALKPAFVRFPGGCWVEGDTMAEAYRWKQTIGPEYARRTQWNIWGYWATHGLGYHEYLQLCEDLGAQALFVINCGMSHRGNVPMEQMGALVQDALDALEYALGPAASRWGAVRAKAGHPTPFPLKYLEIGNENGGPAYDERYRLMADAVKARYPQVKLIANVWSGVPGSRPLEIVDEHYYSTPEFFIAQAHKYDTYDRKGPQVYVGEFACTQGSGQGNQRAAVGEAAFMMGLERNSDVVVMASYAPLFVHHQHRRWNPDLIVHDNTGVYGTPSYYAQQMFSLNRGDTVLPVTIEQPPVARVKRCGGIGVGSWRTEVEFKDLRVESAGKVLFAQPLGAGAPGWKPASGQWMVQEGVYRQTSQDENCRTFLAQGADWTNYTYTLKARRLSGAEGFLVVFHAKDPDNFVWWNVGGWGNATHALEVARGGGKETFDAKPGKVETGRWYDVKVSVNGDRIQCWLDGNMIHNIAVASAPLLPVQATASYDIARREVIMKVANVSDRAVEADLLIEGVKVVTSARAIELSANDPWDENSMAKPRNIAPREREIRMVDGRVRLALPPWSLGIYRVSAKR